MSLTAAEKTTLKAAITGDATANAFPNTGDGNFDLAVYLNTVPAAPTSVWRADIDPAEIGGAVVMADFIALTAVKQNGLILLTQGSRVDASQANVRTGFSSTFGAGATLTALTALAQRAGTRFEVIFSSAAGAANVSTKFNVKVTATDVADARNS